MLRILRKITKYQPSVVTIALLALIPTIIFFTASYFFPYLALILADNLIVLKILNLATNTSTTATILLIISGVFLKASYYQLLFFQLSYLFWLYYAECLDYWYFGPSASTPLIYTATTSLKHLVLLVQPFTLLISAQVVVLARSSTPKTISTKRNVLSIVYAALVLFIAINAWELAYFRVNGFLLLRYLWHSHYWILIPPPIILFLALDQIIRRRGLDKGPQRFPLAGGG